MRKIYSLITAMLLGGFLASNAANTTVTLSEETLAHLENYRLTKLYDFVSWTYNGEAMSEWKWSETAASFKINNYEGKGTAVFQITTEELNNLYLQAPGSGGQYPRTIASENGKACGIFNGANGGRIFSIGDLKAGMVVVLQGGTNDANKPWTKTILTYTDNVTELTDSVHTVQEAQDNDGDGEADGTNDGYNYYRIESDGRLDLSLERSNWIAAYAILIDKNMAEYVESPIQKLKRVENAYRKIEVKTSSSSFGNPVKTYYSLDGSDPINMRDTDVELRKDTTWVRDEETGEIVIDENTGEPQIDHVDIVYVQEPVMNEDSGEWGDWIYENEIEISDGDDEDGDGYVTVKVACITDEGVMSSVSSVTYSVGEITLNTPVLTLVGMNETSRSYQLSWPNNTLCEEDYSFTYETDEGDAGDMVIGDIISIKSGITVTVSAEGYSDGILVMGEVERQGISYTRKNAELAEAGKHDWDFQNLSEDMVKIFNHEVVDYYYSLVYDGEEIVDTIKYDAEKVDAGEIDVPDNVETAYKYYGWNDPETSNARTTLHVIVDTLVNEETGEVTTNAYYDEEKTGIFNGLTINCPPNSANNSTIFMYTNDVLGAYFMSKPTIAVDNTVYGEYVVMGLGQGGSNYVDRTWSSCEMNENPEGPYETTLAASIHVFYIDIYTSNELPDVIEKVEGNSANFANVYSIDGRIVRANANVGNALNGLAKGIYIMNGKKYLVK